jgi:hypothetical protein
MTRQQKDCTHAGVWLQWLCRPMWESLRLSGASFLVHSGFARQKGQSPERELGATAASPRLAAHQAAQPPNFPKLNGPDRAVIAICPGQLEFGGSTWFMVDSRSTERFHGEEQHYVGSRDD